MAHVDYPGPPSVSKYGVDIEAIERVGVAALRRAIREDLPAIVDEVGKMELACDRFVEILMEAVKAPIPVLGTIHARKDPVSRRIRRHPQTRIVEITRENRDAMPAQLARNLEEIRG